MTSMTGSVLWTRAMATAIDEESIQRYGIPTLDLMERAGRAVAQAIEQRSTKKQPVIILAGRGNNGGDALVAGRLLKQAGWNVRIYEITENPNNPGTPSYQEQRRRVLELNIPFQEYEASCLSHAEKNSLTLIDGVLGLGFRGPEIRPHTLAALQEAASLAHKTVIAVDIPSGMAADDWLTKETPLPADVTVTFGAAKPIHVLSPARTLCGEVVIAPIGFAEEAVTSVCEQATPRFVQAHSADIVADDPWQSLSRDAHKYDRGHVLVLGGSEGKWGAPILAALAALRCGAGWATLGFAPTEQPRLTTMPPDLTYEHFAHGKDFDWEKVARFIRERRVRALIVGPGMMHSPMTELAVSLLAPLMKEQQLCCVFDAGALQGLGDVLANTALPEGHTIITPHPGEWLKLSTHPLSLQPMEELSHTLQTLKQWGVAALYKLATPIALNPQLPKDVFVLNAGTQTLAKAGSGDVLSGAIAAQLLAGADITQAMLRGQSLLYRAATDWEKHHSRDGLIPSDLLRHLAEKN